MKIRRTQTMQQQNIDFIRNSDPVIADIMSRELGR